MKWTLSILIWLVAMVGLAQTTDSIPGRSEYYYHRFSSDYRYLHLNLKGGDHASLNLTQKIYDTHTKQFVDWDEYPRDQYDDHSQYNLYLWYPNVHLSNVKNTGSEGDHEPIISVPHDHFIRLLEDGSMFCADGGGRNYIKRPNGRKEKLTHKFNSKFKPPTTYQISYDGRYAGFKRFYWKGSESFQAFEIQDLIKGEVLKFEYPEKEMIRIDYVTEDMILYEDWGSFPITDYQGNVLYKLGINRRSGNVINFFTIDDIHYVVQRGGFRMGQEGGVDAEIHAFQKGTGYKIRSKKFMSAIDIVPVKDNEFMVLYRDYNEHLENNYDVNSYEGIGEGLAVEYLDQEFNTVEFKYIQNSTRKASREKWQPPYPEWVSGIRVFQVVEQGGAYKMVRNKELFGFRLSDGTFINNADAEGKIKLANHVDPNQFLCACSNRNCHGGFVQNVVRPSKQFDTKYVTYETTSSGVTYKKTTTFKAGDDSPYSYETKCSTCNGQGYQICKDRISK